jgi:hypothetical protein
VDLFEELNILERTEDSAAAGNPSFQVDLAGGAVGEAQREAVFSGVANAVYAWKRTPIGHRSQGGGPG